MNVDFPFQFDSRGRTASTDLNDHIRDMVEQVLFTSPGERVNRPDFGCGLLQMVFAPNSTEVAGALEFTTQASLQRELSDVIDLRQVSVNAADATLTVTINYVVRNSQQSRTDTFVRGVP